MKSKVAIIGAGATGRGFIARLLADDGAQISFVDKNPELVERLNGSGSYTIYLGKAHAPVEIRGIEAFAPETPEAIARIAGADYVFVSVGEQNLPEVAPLLIEASRRSGGALRVVVCENGISPKQVLREAVGDGAPIQITQGVIFCTTIPSGEIDILSEQYDELPYDVDDGLFELPFRHFKRQAHFDVLLERKIYTYNCLSACIAYVGYLKGYSNYAEAANDEQIHTLCERLSAELTEVISKEYGIPFEEQRLFADCALRKFMDSAIADTIFKNARSAERKLSSNERLAGPLYLFAKHREDTTILSFTTACAFAYLRREELASLLEDGFVQPMDYFLRNNPNMEAEILWQIRQFYVQINNDGEIRQIIAGILTD